MTRTELETLITQYENQVGRGKMDNAALTLAEIIRSLADVILPQEAKLNPPPCAPCDVSIPNNPVLIDQFKSTISVDVPEAEPVVEPVVEPEPVIEPVIEAPAEPVVEVETVIEAPVEETADSTVDAADEEPTEEAAAEEPAAEVTAEDGVDPAPKTPKKPKA
jgi:hypothetical protein